MKFQISLFLLFLFIFNTVVFASSKDKERSKKFEPSEKSWKAADKLLKKMSVEEKVGQLIQIGINARFINQDSDFFQDLKRQVTENKIGGVIFFGAPMYETVQLGNRLQENADIPLLFALDAETGIGMRFSDAANFPWNMAVAATGNPEYAYKMGVITGREAKAMGLMQVYAPVLDVNNNADNPVINVRSYSEDPETVARFGSAFIEGVQSQGVIATAKHFPGHGDTDVDSHRGLPIINVSRERLDKLELVPFKKAIESGVASIMVAHIGLPQIDPTEIKPIPNAIRVDTDEEVISENATLPATLSPKIQTEILRNQLGFKGLIVTDAMSMSGLTLYVTQEEAGVQAFLAGADLLEKPADTDAMIRGLRDAVKSGRISEVRLNESVRKILAWKHELGLFKQKITPIDQIDKIVAGKETHALAEEIANKAVTLVKNEDNLLPLSKDKKVFVLGISNGFDGDMTSVALVKFLRENGVKFSATLLQDNSSPDQIERARALANRADVVIAAMYGRVRSGAKNSVGLPDSGVNILRDLLKKDKKVVGVSFGNPYILESFPTLKTYVVAYGDMTTLQRASMRSVFGMLEPTGKLPISLPGLVPRGTGLSLAKAK
ncbi:MAG TPA: glycoside hydrolase family 3 N-terminal domain-containing protein [Pyrinomonadaceae bacterium]|jgi:beta-glucosidase-like glycosyl hydrolase